MRKFVHLSIVSIVLLALLSGCWDQRLFKEAKLGMAGSFDVAKHHQIRLAVSIPTIIKTSQGPGQEQVQVIDVEAHTPRQARMKIDRETSKNFDASKMRVVLISEKLAKQKIFPLLDIFYRDPQSALNADLALVTGGAEEALTLGLNATSRPSEYLGGLLDSARYATYAGKNKTIQGICGKMLDPGSDVTIPIIDVVRSKGIAKVTGLALFNMDRYTGKTLTPEQSTLFLLMRNEKGHIARLSAKVLKNQKPDMANYVTIEAKKTNSKLKVTVDKNGEISAHINSDLTVRVIEYPKDELDSAKEIKKLDQKLSKILTKKSQRLIKKLQKADSDAFGVGRHLMAFHHDTWKKIKWKKVYPTIPFTSEVHVEIVQHGIMN